MSRVLSAPVLSAASNPNGVSYISRLTVYKNRHFFETIDVHDHSPSWADVQGISIYPLPQDVKFCYTQGKVLTIAVKGPDIGDEGPTIWMGFEGYNMVKVTSGVTPLYCATYNRPTLACDADEDFVYYVDVAGQIQKAVINSGTLWTGVTSGSDAVNCVTSVSEFYHLSQPSASLHSLTQSEIAVLYVDDGGVTAGIVGSSGSYYESDQRFMYADMIWSSGSPGSIASLNFSGAAMDGDGIVHWYLSYPNGSVWGMQRATDGTFSDPFEAVPSDLSMFKITNACISKNGLIHLVGQFNRDDPKGFFDSSYIYNLDLWSRDGRTFSLDRFTLFGMANISAASPGKLGTRFMLACRTDSPTVYYADANRVITSLGIWATSGTDAPSISIDDLIELGGDMANGWRIPIPNGDGLYWNNPFIAVGNVAILDIGVNVPSSGSGMSFEYFQMDRCIISNVEYSMADARRNCNLQLTSLSNWKTAVMTHPFYLEMQSKQSHHTSGSDVLNNLYSATISGKMRFPFVIDFWGKENNGPRQHGANIDTTLWSGDIKDTLYLLEYPIVETTPLTILMYGWSRAGPFSQSDPPNPSADDPDPDDAPNDLFSCVVKVLRSNVETDIIITQTSSGSNNHAYPPETWKSTHVGSYPVSLNTGAQLLPGDVVTEIGFRTSSKNTDYGGAVDDTTYYCERVEIPNLWMELEGPGEDWEDTVIPYSQYTPTGFEDMWSFVDGADGWEVTYPGFGEDSNAYWSAGQLNMQGVSDSTWYNAEWSYYFPDWANQFLVCTPDTGIEISGEVGIGLSACGIWAVVGDRLSADLGSYGNGGTFYFPDNSGRRMKGVFWGSTDHGVYTKYMTNFRVFGLCEMEIGNGTMEWKASTAIWQDYNLDTNRYTDGMSHFFVKDVGGAQYIIFKVNYPANLGVGRLAMQLELVSVDDGSTYPVKYNSTEPDWSPTIGSWHSNSMNLTVGSGPEWYVDDCPDFQRTTFNNYGYIGLNLSAGGTNKIAEIRIHSIEWRGAVTTVLWDATDMPNVIPADEQAKSLIKPGVPSVYLDSLLYSTFDFEVSAKYEISGSNAWGGACGLATDGYNYIAGRASLTKLQIVKVRDNMHTVLAEKNIDLGTHAAFWIVFEHRDGRFRVRLRTSLDNYVNWERDNGELFLEYYWQEEDGALAETADYLHVGIYAMRDIPYFRISSLDTGQSDAMGILPFSGSWEFMGSTTPPASGTIRASGKLYDYSTYVAPPSTVRGPYQCRNTGLRWSYTDGVAYSGNAVEFTWFNWLDNATYWNLVANKLMASNSGIAWVIDRTDWTVSTRNAGTTVFLRNRSRHFGAQVNGDLLGSAQKMWVCGGFTGLVAQADSFPVSEGEICYIEVANYVRVSSYMGSSGYIDATVEDIIEKICQIAGAEATFPGDILAASHALSAGQEWLVA